MELKYNVTGERRKALVNAICGITGADKEYLGAPSFAYRVDYFTIDRNGTVSFDDRGWDKKPTTKFAKTVFAELIAKFN